MQTKTEIDALKKKIQLHGTVPEHVAVIMDGNGRWAQKRLQPRVFGHRKGAESARSIVEIAAEIGLKALTLYTFSEENWGRPAGEVTALMALLRRYILKEKDSLKRNNIQLRAIGGISRLPSETSKLLRSVEESLSTNTGMVLNIAISYGARTEITEACKSIASKVKEGLINLDDVNHDCFAQHLFTKGLKDPDLLIRTSGEMRISNFMLWQLAYSEFCFTDTLWPDFGKKDFLTLILEFQKRNRRYGLVESASSTLENDRLLEC